MMFNPDCIHAYLTPDPLNDDNAMEDESLSWLHGFLNEPDEEQGLPAIIRDENIYLYSRIEEDAKSRLAKAIENLWPLLKNHHFRSVQIAIDIFGILLSKQAIAGYNHQDSAPAEGRYLFILSNSLLQRYQISKAENKPISFHDDQTWEHELIHLLDHWEILKGHLFQSSTKTSEITQASILKFRSEGIADLYYLMHGYYESIGSIEAAKTRFQEYFSDWKEKNALNLNVEEQTRDSFLSTGLYYTAGPWLVLDLLRDFRGGWFRVTIDQCLDLIQQKKPVDRDTILQVIQTALTVDCRTFLDYGESLLAD
jgi:hypothetical protein